MTDSKTTGKEIKKENSKIQTPHQISRASDPLSSGSGTNKDAIKTLLLAFSQEIGTSIPEPNNRNYILSKSESPHETTSTRESTSNESLSNCFQPKNLALSESLIEVLHSIERSNHAHRELFPFINRIYLDLMEYVNRTKVQQEPQELFNLLFQYESLNGDPIASKISRADLNAFLQTIPIQALEDCIKNTELVKKGLCDWLQFRLNEKEKELQRLLPTPVYRHSSTPFQSTVHNSGHKPSSDYNASTTNSVSESASSSNRSSTSPERREVDLIDEINAEKKKEKLASLGIDVEKIPTSTVVGQCCLQCDSDDTPEWRRGPYGPRSLCNACGLFYGKLVKRFGKDQAAQVMERRKSQGNGKDRRIPIE
ncbi:unnamed protein product [Wickerhamomyces anomalus]